MEMKKIMYDRHHEAALSAVGDPGQWFCLELHSLKTMAWFFLCALSWFTNGYASLASGTKLTTLTQDVNIESVSPGDLLLGYNPFNQTLSSVAIKYVTAYQAKAMMRIITNIGFICASSDQLFYECSKQNFVAAADLRVGNVLRTCDNAACVCLAIEHIDIPTTMYDLELDEPHIFFVSDVHVMVHNSTLLLSALPNLFVQALNAFAGFCVGFVCLYIDRPTDKLITPQQAGEKMHADMNRFADDYYYTYDAKKVRRYVYGENYRNNSYTSMCQPYTHGGITIDLKTSQDIFLFPRRYGPLHLVAFMTSSGTVSCTMWVDRFSHRKDNGQAVFILDILGKVIFQRNNSFVADFIKTEDRQQLKDLETLIRSWPSSARLDKAKSCFEKIIYGITFSASALYRIVEKRIAPSFVGYAIKHGASLQAYNADHMIYDHVSANVAVVIDKRSNKVINVGYHSNLQEMNPQPEQKQEKEGEKEKIPQEEETEEKVVKTVEDILKSAKPSENKGQLKQFEKPGGYDEALKDFESLGVTDVKNIGVGKTGTLPDGRQITVRMRSRDTRPTLEIQSKASNKIIKIRYGTKC